MTNDFVDSFNVWLTEYFSCMKNKNNYVEDLFKSKEYSLKSTGKRFRPFLTATVFQIWNQNLKLIKNTCLAIEMIHTYSLIHDDLPCMDNDDFRRGLATNHKVFGEDIALLAGDALLTEAFYLISSDENVKPDVRLQLIRKLSENAGSFGMVGGQALDMKSNKKIGHVELEKIHLMKTAYLIEYSAFAGALIAGAQEIELDLISQFGINLGLAFQIKDDLLDFKSDQQDHKNYVSVLGSEQTQIELRQKSDLAAEALKKIQSKASALQSLSELINSNAQRNT